MNMNMATKYIFVVADRVFRGYINRVGDIITCGKDRYVVLAIENDIEYDLCGAYIFDGEQTAYFINSDLEDFKRTGESVAFNVEAIIDTLQESDD